jgi:hypothetical protein
VREYEVEHKTDDITDNRRHFRHQLYDVDKDKIDGILQQRRKTTDESEAYNLAQSSLAGDEFVSLLEFHILVFNV